MFSFIIKLIKIKFIFKRPLQKEILIYDRESLGFAELLFEKKKLEFLDTRYESINLFVLLIAIKKYGIRNIKNNYKKIFLETVSPKIVYTSIDNNPAFYTLKYLYKNAKYISDQNGMRDNKFFHSCKKIKENNKEHLIADHIFLFGKNEKKRISKIIKGNIHHLGNTKNNYYFIKNQKKSKKIKSLMFIPSGTYYKSALGHDKKIFAHLNKFCSKYKIKLSICSRGGSSNETFYRENFSRGKWTYIPQVNQMSTYKKLNVQQMVVFAHSTLGFEAFSKGIKCAVFHENFPIKDHYIKYPKSGIFWSDSKDYYDIEKTLKKVINFSNNSWGKIVKKYSSEILIYDKKNLEKSKIINRILK